MPARRASKIRRRPAARVSFELVAPWKTLRRETAGVGAIAAPVGKLLQGEREGAVRGVLPGQPLRALEGLHVRKAAVLVALQPHARAARHLGELFEREDHHLAVVADG